jgi:hypothetical protein
LRRQIGVDAEEQSFLDAEEQSFRAGLVTALAWATQVARQMTQEGKPPPEIADMLYDLLNVALDYEAGQVEMSVANPWEWSRSTLELYISWRKSEWPKDPANG